MKMVKSLLLGSAAALVAVTAGQAADLPVKAKPVEYVKVCSLYGAGFYYMPGTDMCIKIGGWVRTEFVYGQVNGSLTWGPFAGNSNNRGSTSEAFRARGYITADAREQTAYGTARAYIDVGINTNDAGLQVANLALSSNRAFLQWAGITAGLTQSFYDFYSVPAASFRGGYYPASDTGDPGWFTWGYTAQLGNGLSATIATEARRTTQIINQAIAPGAGQAGIAGLGTVTPGTCATTSCSGTLPAQCGSGSEFPGNGAYGGMQAGDFVGNIRIDQTWGSAQVMAAAHELNPATSVNREPAVLAGRLQLRARSSERSVGLCRWRWPAAELPDDRPGRLLPVAGQLYPRCVALPLLHAQHELGQDGREQRNLRRAERLRVRRRCRGRSLQPRRQIVS